MNYEDIKTFAERYDEFQGIVTNAWVMELLHDEIEELRGLIEAKSKPLTDESIGEVAIQDTQYHGYAMAIKPHIQVALEEGTKLYTSPPQRKPLTEEQLVEAYCCVNDKEWAIGGMTDARIFARAIERAHGIGGKE